MLRVVLLIGLLLNLVACSSSSQWKGIYGEEVSQEKSTKLDVPPDLSEPDTRAGLELPTIAADGSTYLTYSKSEKDEKDSQVLPAKPLGVKVVRDGADQWLEVNMPVDKLWLELKAFFKSVGFDIKREDKALGIMDTTWQENKVALPAGFFSKLLNRFSSTGLRDKYRARLEKTADAKVTRLFITHQGLKEFASDEENNFKIWWATRPSEPELEAEMYQRFLIFKDVGIDKSLKLVSKAAAKDRTQVIDKDDSKVLQVAEGFARTWRRVGIALDRIGLLVDDRNRTSGLYYLRITDDFREKIQQDENWLAGLFSADKKTKLKDRYLLNVSAENGISTISIYEITGAKADADFVKQLLSDLKLYLN